MIADIQKFEDAARMAMGHFEGPHPRGKGRAVGGLDRWIGWTIASLVVVAVAVIALS